MTTLAKRPKNWLPEAFNDFFNNDWMEKMNATAPAINVIESENDYKVELAAPGMQRQDFEIYVDEDNELVISMEKKDEKKEEDKKCHYLRREFSYSKFQQNLILPDNVDKDNIDAKVNDGVLTVSIPKKALKDKEKATKKIDVK